MDNNISNQNRNQNNNNMGNNFGRGQNRKSMVLCLIVALGIFLVFSLMNRQVEKARDKEISYDQFLQLLDVPIWLHVVWGHEENSFYIIFYGKNHLFDVGTVLLRRYLLVRDSRAVELSPDVVDADADGYPVRF